MHSMIVSVTALLLVNFELLGFGFPSALIPLTLGVSVPLIGLPHGAADHIAGRRIMQPLFQRNWPAVFFAAYIAVCFIVLFGWYVVPVLTALAFFALAAWHFGTEEVDHSSTHPLAHLRAVACGGLVIWVPCVIQGSNVASLLQIVAETITAADAATIVNFVALLGPALVLLVLQDCWVELREFRISDFGGVRLLRSKSMRYSSLAFLFCVADPLLSFCVYFCGWHSILGWRALQQQFGCSLLTLAKLLAPLTLIAASLITLGSLLWSSGLTVSETTIRWVFLGLSSVAVPHVLFELFASSRLAPSNESSNATVGAVS